MANKPGRPKKNTEPELAVCKDNTVELQTEINCLKNKCEQYERLIATYKKAQEEATSLLRKATIEYNARIEYMLDCAKHNYMAMQFAVLAGHNKQEAENGN